MEDSLKNHQYKTADKLNARIGLHELYSTNKQNWQNWVFEQLELPANAKILELGCGTANL